MFTRNVSSNRCCLRILGMLFAILTFFYTANFALATERDYFSKDGYKEFLYDNSTGLGSGAANDIVQTGDGFIWIATYNGLIRYDGNEFYHYSASYGVNSVSALFVDNKDNLWIGTNDNGVKRYKQGNFVSINKENGLASNIIRGFAENADGTIWIGTTQGLCSIKNDKVQPFEYPGLKNKYIAQLKKGLGNKIVGVTVKGDLFVIDGDKLESYISQHKVPIGLASTICPDKFEEDLFWIGTTGAAVLKARIKNGEIKLEETLFATGLENINYLVHHNNDLLVASDKGIGVFDENKIFHMSSALKLKHSVERIMVDYEDNIWFTSTRQGVSKLTKTRFTNLFEELGLRPAVVNSVYEGKDGLYIASDNGLMLLKNNTPVQNSLTKLLRNARTRQVIEDRNNNIWVTTYSNSGLVKYSPDGNITLFNEGKGMPTNRTRVVLEASDGSIYVGTRYGMAIIRNNAVVKTIGVSDGLPNPQVLCLLEANGKVYAGTDGGGICIIENDKIAGIISEKDGLNSGVILRMTNDIDSKRIWISTGSAVCYYEEGKVHRVPNFPSTNNFDFVFTPYGEMLITCNNGIYVTTSKKLRDTGSFVQLISRRDGLSDSLTANSFNYIDAKDNLFLCTQSGINIMNVHQIADNGKNLKLIVPSVNADGKELYFDDSRELNIGRDLARLTFKSYILSNALNNSTIYCYLEGFDKEPDIYSRFSNKEKSYTNLPGGTYKLHAGIYDAKSDRLVKELVYTINKEKKITEYVTFWALLSLIPAGIIFWSYRVYMNKRLKNMAEKQKETEHFLDQVINSFATAIDLKDHYTQGHSKRVADYSRQIAVAMGWSEEDAEKIHRIGMLHDVGKVIIPGTILNKKGALTDEEYAVMKTHTDIGSQILSNITSFPDIAVGADTHHERYDGRGYGHHLVGEDIPIEGRIIAVADTFDAMNSNRIYRPKLTRDAILNQLVLARNTQLDGRIVDVLLKLIEKGEVVIEENVQKPE